MGFLLLAHSGADASPDPLVNYKSQVPAWEACDPGAMSDDYKAMLTLFGERARRAVIKVPLDYADPARGDIEVALLKVAGKSHSGARPYHQPGGRERRSFPTDPVRICGEGQPPPDLARANFFGRSPSTTTWVGFRRGEPDQHAIAAVFSRKLEARHNHAATA